MNFRDLVRFRFLWVVLAHMITGMLIVYFYYSKGVVPLVAVPVHGGLTFSVFVLAGLGGILMSLLAGGLIRTVPAGKIRSHFCAFFVVSASLILIFNHLSAFLGYLFWADRVGISAMIIYLPMLSELAHAAGLGSGMLKAGFSLLPVVVIVHLFLYKVLVREFISYDSSLKKFRQRWILTAVAGIIILTIFGIYAYLTSDGKLRGEPFANALRNNLIYTVRFNPPGEWLQVHIEARYDYKSKMEQNPVDLTDKPHLIVIMLDAARADHMSVYGYERQTTPFMDSLYTSGDLVKIEFATSPCASSKCGIMGMLSSVFMLRNHPMNFSMQETLSFAGYNTRFLLSGDHSRAYRVLRAFYGDNLTTFRDGFDMDDKYYADDAGLFEFIDELPDANEGAPEFKYIHLMSPHSIGAVYDEYHIFQPSAYERLAYKMYEGLAGNRSAEHLELIRNTYDNKIFQSDNFIRKIFEKLDSKGFLENSVIAITSDHGEGLGEHDYFGHGDVLYNHNIRVPLLFFKNGGFEDPFFTDFGSLLDIAPTLFSEAGLLVPDSWEGYALQQNNREWSHHMVPKSKGAQAVTAVVDGSKFKLIRNKNNHHFELYNLDDDPGEINNLYNTAPDDLVDRMKQLFQIEFDL